jgi:hypothetical protein
LLYPKVSAGFKFLYSADTHRLPAGIKKFLSHLKFFSSLFGNKSCHRKGDKKMPAKKKVAKEKECLPGYKELLADLVGMIKKSKAKTRTCVGCRKKKTP